MFLDPMSFYWTSKGVLYETDDYGVAEDCGDDIVKV